MIERIVTWVKATPWVYVSKIALAILGAWLMKKFLMDRLKRWARKTQSSWENEVVQLLDRAMTPLLSVGLFALALNLLPLPDKFLKVMNRCAYFGLLAIALYYGSKLFQVLLNYWLARQSSHLEWREPIRFMSRVVFAAIGTMFVLDNLGISLTAVWTTLGVGSVAIALALQDTLSNFFAGVYIRLDSPVRLGDYIKLDGGYEGFVAQIGWRSTRIRTLPNNIVVVPNAKLATAVITNYSLPETQMSLLVPISVSYDSDPEKVERILIEEASKAARDVEGLLTEPAPFVRFIPGFGESSLGFTLICRVSTYVDQYLAQHELRKRILARFRKERVQIPYPQRDVHVIAEAPLDLRAAAHRMG
ncbi:MAG TPA: mechanosensitive ion channel family protein [Candidatus Bathyarchaeia archaeon]|jgi:small-conductance mechanosensitive channel|nr:mechanosensitive ion channel family protein [Candidatus Bathyarchaeia archaeon]